MKGKSTLLARIPTSVIVACILLAVMLVGVAQAGGPYYYTARKYTGSDTTYADYFTMTLLAAASGVLSAPGLPNGYLGFYVSSNTPIVKLRTATYSINLPESGIFKVYATFGATTNAKPNVLHKVTDRFGNETDAPFIDQTEGAGLVNTWQELGTYDFKANDAAHCKVVLTNSNQNSSGSLYAGALKFELVGRAFPELTSAAKNEEGTAVELAWSAPTHGTVDHYIIERSDGDNQNFAVLDADVAASETTYSDGSGECDVLYYYRIKAVDSNNVTSLPSNEKSSVKCTTASPNKAINPDPYDWEAIVQTDLANRQVADKVSWTAGSGAVDQDIYFGTDESAVTDADKQSPEYKGTISSSVNSYKPAALAANTQYYWRIDSVNLSGTTKGDVWTFKTGVSLKLVAVRKTDRGFITWPDGRAWNEISWHEAGETVDFAVEENTGVTWVGWSLNASGTPIFEQSRELDGYEVPGAHTTLYAVFQNPTYTLTVVADPVAGGSVTKSNKTWPAASDFEEGDVAEIKVTPAAGYLFAGAESNKNGTFNDPLATTSNYTMTADNTTVTAYFAKAVTNIVATGSRGISAQALDGTGEDWWTTQINIGAYSPTNNQLYCRPMIQFKDWAGFQTFPAQSLLHGMGKINPKQTTLSSYSSSVTIQVRAFEVLKPWVYTTDDNGAWWLTTDGVTPWANPGGDFGEQLGQVTNWVSTEEAFRPHFLPSGKDYRYLMRNGIQLKSDQEGLINYRKGMTKDTSVNLFYNPPSGAGNVIRDWAYLGSYAHGVAADHEVRIDKDFVVGTYDLVPVNETQLAAKTGATLAGKTWAFTTLDTDIGDINGANFYGSAQDNSASYFAVYVNNPGANIYPAYMALGSDDMARVWTNGNMRGSKLIATAVGIDQSFIGPFTLLSGWNKVLVKVENGTGGHGIYARLANADRTAIQGLTYSTKDDVAPSNPTSATEAGGALNGVAQSAVKAPKFSLLGATDDKSGLRGYKIYFGTDANGVPNVWHEIGTPYQAPEKGPGTYYLRVAAVDYALNAAAVTTLFTFIVEEEQKAGPYGISNKATLDAATAAAAATTNFTVWGSVSVIDANTFTVDDGSGVVVKVVKTSHGLNSGDYASATGALDVSGPQPVVTAVSVKKQN